MWEAAAWLKITKIRQEALLAALAVCGIGILFSILIVLGVDIYRKHTYTSVILPDAYRITDMKAKEHTSYSVNGDNTDYVYIITVKYEIDGTSYTDTLQILQGTHFATELHARYLADNAPEEVLGNLYYSEKDPSHMNSTPFVRQYDILSNKWGVLTEYQTNDIRRSSNKMVVETMKNI